MQAVNLEVCKLSKICGHACVTYHVMFSNNFLYLVTFHRTTILHGYNVYTLRSTDPYCYYIESSLPNIPTLAS